MIKYLDERDTSDEKLVRGPTCVEETWEIKKQKISSEQPLYEIGVLWATRNIHISN